MDETSDPPRSEVPIQNGDPHRPANSQSDREAQPVDDEQPPRLPFAVVGIGASAGGLEAVGEFLKVMPSNSGMAFVFILHLAPDRHSLVAEILSRHTEMSVAEVRDGMAVEPNHVYVIRPAHVLTIKEGHLHLGPQLDGPRAANRPVDDFFKSLAQEQRERAIAIIMSGMGSNGSAGAQAIKAVGGLCIAQGPETAQFPSMPRHLIDAGYADFISRLDEMPEVLLQYTRHPYAAGGREADAATILQREQQHVREIVAVLRTRLKQDFSGYKRPTVLRRIQRRMGLARITQMSEYAKLLRQSPAEVSGLSDDLLIHVTGFFRDPEAWDVLRTRVVVPLVAGKENGSAVRCWVTACSSGEEAYSLAMLFVEETERTGKHLDVKVFATDMADRTLANARAGIYRGGIEADLSVERLGRFFEKEDATYRVRQDLRECVVFAPQNLLQDPPFSRLDIATCRNLLIYLESDVQQRVLSLLHFGLREGGTLFLGNSESLGDSDELFEPLDKKARLFRRVGPTRHGMVDFPLPHALRQSAASGSDSALALERRPGFRPTFAQLTQRTLLEHHLPAAVLIDRENRILHFQGNTRPFLEQPNGEPTRDLMALARDGVRGAIRVALHHAIVDHSTAAAHDGWVETEPGHRSRLSVIVSPVADRSTGEYFVVSFDLKGDLLVAEGIAPSPDITAGMADDIRQMRDELQSSVEELQTSNEELKASHEEVVSINEELQSSNEELETSKEEMQSLNEELATVNTQLRAKMEEHQSTSNDLASLLKSTDLAVLFLDPQFRIRWFTPPVRDLLELIVSDVGRPLSDLAKKFSDPDLQNDGYSVLERLVPIEREVRANDGRWFIRRMTPYRTTDNRIDGLVLAFVDITARKTVETALRASEEQFRRSIEDAPIPVIMQADDGEVLQVSRTWTELTGYTLADVPNASAWLTRAYGPGAEQVRGHMHDLFSGARKTLDVEFTIRTRSGDARHWSFRASAPGTLAGGRRFMVGMAGDITERRRAEEALRASEGQLRAIYNSSHEYIGLLAPDGTLLKTNRASLEFGGNDEQEVLGRPFWETVWFANTPGMPERAKKAIKAAAKGEPFRAEVTLARPTGELRTFDFSLHPIKDDQGKVVLIVPEANDITDFRRVEERLRLATAAARMGIWTLDADTGMHTRDANLNQLLDLDPVETTQPFTEFLKRIHPADRDGVAAGFEKSLRDGEPLVSEFRIVRPDGQLRWLRDQGDVFGDAAAGRRQMAGACVDVTERREMELALRYSEERFRLVVEGARDFAMLLFDETGKITAWNSGAERLLGYTEAEAIGQNAAIIFTPEDRAAGASDREFADAARSGHADDERWHVRKDGSRLWGSGVLSALRNPDGSARGFVKVLRDESVRKQLGEAREAALEAAELAGHAKDEFLATLSHELRTPLSAILLWAKMLKSTSDTESLDEGLAAIRNSADAQKQLIEDLLDTSRITSGNLRLDLKPTDLAVVVESAIESVLPTAQVKDVAVKADVADRIGIVRVDPHRMKQVMWNLLTNAVKFTPAGGSVSIKLRRRDQIVEVSVTDTGKGISAEFLPRVFELFQQADSTTTRTHGGLGLGLAICKKLVEQHGGTITATSEGADRGSTFTVSLPLPKLRRAGQPESKSEAVSDDQPLELQGTHVLLVEDEVETRKVLGRVLRQAGARVTLAASAAAALEAYGAARPDLLVSDIGMPGEDGYSLIEKIRGLERQAGSAAVPAVALTAFVGAADRRKALAAGFDVHLGKPIDGKQLLAALGRLLSR